MVKKEKLDVKMANASPLNTDLAGRVMFREAVSGPAPVLLPSQAVPPGGPGGRGRGLRPTGGGRDVRLPPGQEQDVEGALHRAGKEPAQAARQEVSIVILPLWSGRRECVLSSVLDPSVA